MMHCHVCDEDVPLDETANHVRLFHPDAHPIAEPVEVEVHDTTSTRELADRVRRLLKLSRLGR